MKIKVTNPTDTPRAFVTADGIQKVRTGESKELSGVKLTAESRKALVAAGIVIEDVSGKAGAKD